MTSALRCILEQAEEATAQSLEHEERIGLFLDAVDREVTRARRQNLVFRNHHEAFGVILEEVDEYWDEVKKRRRQRNAANMYRELTQIAAMAACAAAELLEAPALEVVR